MELLVSMSKEIKSHNIASFYVYVALTTFGAYVALECNTVQPKLLIDRLHLYFSGNFRLKLLRVEFASKQIALKD